MTEQTVIYAIGIVMASDDWDEKRIDIIGSNGNTGEHYEGIKKMDEADLGNMQVAMNEERSIKYAQERAKELEVQPVGHCLFCGEKFLTDSRMRFCDAFCRDGYDREKALRR